MVVTRTVSLEAGAESGRGGGAAARAVVGGGLLAADFVVPEGGVAAPGLGLAARGGGQLARAGGVVQALPGRDERDVAGRVVGGFGVLENAVAGDGLTRIRLRVVYGVPGIP